MTARAVAVFSLLAATPVAGLKQEPRRLAAASFEAGGGTKDGPTAPALHEHKFLYNHDEWVRSQSQKEALIVGKGLAKNLCEDGHYIPELYLIGATGSGTTTLASDLDRSPAIQFATGHGPLALANNHTMKEGHFFDFHANAGRQLLPKSFPTCQQKTHVVAVEASARYLMDPKVPERVYNRYLTLPLEPGKLKFVVLLRDPLHRLHTDFYHAVKDGLCGQLEHKSFATYLQLLLEGNTAAFVGGTDHCTDRLEGSLYRDQLVRWFKWFHAPQFTIVPWLYVVAPGTGGRKNDPVASELWKSLNVQAAKPRLGTHLGARTHPPLDEEGLQPKVMADARAFFDERTGPRTLAELFAFSGSQAKRVKLFGYKGDPEDQSAIANWIERNWGDASRPKSLVGKAISLFGKKKVYSSDLENHMPADNRMGINDYNVLAAKSQNMYSVSEWLSRGAAFKNAQIRTKHKNTVNKCQNGWAVPELYVLGSPSAGTTSFASELDASPAIQLPRGWGEGRLPEGHSYKESHAMDTYFYSGHWFFKMINEPCNEFNRVAAVDATSRYILDPNVPRRIKQRYLKKEEYNPLKFMMLLRDPLARFHSDFYASRKAGLCKKMQDMTFAQVAGDILDGKADQYTGGVGECSDRLEGSLYRDQLKRWFKEFHPSQFTIVPWLYQVAPGSNGRDNRTLAEATWEQLGLEPSLPARNTHLMKGDHPSLKDEGLSADQLADLNFFFDKMTGAVEVAKVLASSGANLFGYLGADNDVEAIAKWLVANWGEAPAKVENFVY